MTVDIFAPDEHEHYANVTLLDIDATGGRFGLLERHIDCAASLETGLLAISDGDGPKNFVGIDGGILVKVGPTVTIATGRILAGMALDELEDRLADQRDEGAAGGRQRTRTLARLELQLARSSIQAGGVQFGG